MREGKYAISAQLMEGNHPVGSPALLHIQVDPPWFRTKLAYGGGVMIAALGALLLRRLAFRHANRKQLRLENLVRMRTAELRATMEKLTEEAHTSPRLQSATGSQGRCTTVCSRD
jgi:hypothetical protein